MLFNYIINKMKPDLLLEFVDKIIANHIKFNRPDIDIDKAYQILNYPDDLITTLYTSDHEYENHFKDIHDIDDEFIGIDVNYGHKAIIYETDFHKFTDDPFMCLADVINTYIDHNNKTEVFTEFMFRLLIAFTRIHYPESDRYIQLYIEYLRNNCLIKSSEYVKNLGLISLPILAKRS